MTGQMPDFVVHEGVMFSLAGIGGGRLFDPREHALEPMMISTGCWRGYVCRYAVDEDRLVLRRLGLGRGTKLDGRPLVGGDALLGATVVEASGASASFEGPLAVEGLAWPVPFTGNLLIGHEIVARPPHMGFAPAWRFGHVLDLTFDGGVLRDVRDRSAEMAETRRLMEAGETEDPDGPRGGEGWVERTFRLGYARGLGRPDPPPPEVPVRRH